MIHPIQSCLLIELKGKFKNFEPTDDKWGTSRLQGIVIAIDPDISILVAQLKITVGCRVYFSKYEDNAMYEIEGKNYALMKLEEIRGWSDD